MAFTKPGTSLDLNDLKNLLKCKMHAYLATGTASANELDLYVNNVDAIEELYGGENPVFLPLGDLHKDPISFGWERTTIEMHAGTVREALKINVEIKSAALCKDAIDLLDDPDLGDDCSIMLVPFNVPAAEDVSETNPAKYVILNGVKLADKGEGNGNNAYGTVTFTGTAEPNAIGDVILYYEFV